VGNSTVQLIRHLTHPDFKAADWLQNYSESAVEEYLEMQLFRFQQALQVYLKQYAYNISHEEPTEIDLLLLDAQKSCSSL
jgi:hypothetical protein